MSRKKHKGKISAREQKRRQEQQWRDKGGYYLDGESGGRIKATPIKKGIKKGMVELSW